MNFSILEWLLSKSLDLSIAKSFAALNNLQTRLNKAVDEWAKKLPPTDSLISVAMYLNIHSNNSTDKNLQKVCSHLESGKLPSEAMLSDALYEKWIECKANGADQAFFLIKNEKAKFYADSLAAVILGILVQEKELFNNFVHAQLTHLRTQNKEIQLTLQFLKKNIRKNESFTKPTKKIFRPIPDCRIPVLADSEERKYLLLVLLKISLFRTFSNVKYHKFICLMTYSSDAFYENGNEMAGLSLYTGEIDFLSNLINLVDVFMKDLKLFQRTIEPYYENLEFLKFNLKVQLNCHEGLYNYEIVIDGSAHRYSILQIASISNIDYDHMCSLNSTLRLMPTMTRPSMFIIDHDKITKSPAMTKFIYCCMLEDKVDIERLRINVDDFDDWDFDYVLNSKTK